MDLFLGGFLIKEEIWIEKYRPVKLEDVVGQEPIVKRLKSYVKTRNVPHLLFSGSPGVGKTAAAISMVRELFGENWEGNFIELNASDERGIDVVRHKLKDFARTAPLGDADFKVIFLDEADALTRDAQSALRRTMERYSSICRFVLSCNYSSKIIEPIQSRCAVYRFRSLSDEAVKQRMNYIAQQEGITLTEEGLEAIVYVARGDMRKAINALQAATFLDDRITDEAVYQITATAKPEQISNLIRSALAGEFTQARKLLDDLLLIQGLSGQDVIIQIYRGMLNLIDNPLTGSAEIPESIWVKMMDKIGEIDFRMTEGANERIQLEALLAYVTLVAADQR
ncbi:MAG: replication factor C small subunit [Methanotrichaceae archaeon]